MEKNQNETPLGSIDSLVFGVLKLGEALLNLESNLSEQKINLDSDTSTEN